MREARQLCASSPDGPSSSASRPRGRRSIPWRSRRRSIAQSRRQLGDGRDERFAHSAVRAEPSCTRQPRAGAAFPARRRGGSGAHQDREQLPRRAGLERLRVADRPARGGLGRRGGGEDGHARPLRPRSAHSEERSAGPGCGRRVQVIGPGRGARRLSKKARAARRARPRGAAVPGIGRPAELLPATGPRGRLSGRESAEPA